MTLINTSFHHQMPHYILCFCCRYFGMAPVSRSRGVGASGGAGGWKWWWWRWSSGCRDEDVELLIRFSADMHFSQQGAGAAVGTPGALIPAPSNCCSGWGCSEPKMNRSALGFTNFGFN